MIKRADLLADVVIALAYREDAFDVEAIVADVLAEHGRVALADLDPQAFSAIIARHAR